MATDDQGSTRPSRWWALAGVAAVIAIAWAAGSAGGDLPGTSLPTTGLPDDPIASGADATDLAAIDQAAAFWRAIGSGDTAAVVEMLDAEAGTPLIHYGEFAAAFDAGFHAENCRLVAATTVRCLLGVTNLELVDLFWVRSATTIYVTSASVTFSEGGIRSFQLPSLINTASIRLMAQAELSTGIPAACDRINYNAIELPPFSTSMAQTADCAQALLPFLPGALANLGA